MTTSESSALNLSCGQFGRATCSVIATVQSVDAHTKTPTEPARASCSSQEGHTHAFFHTGWVLTQSIASFGPLLPANDNSWTKTEYYMRQWGFFNNPPHSQYPPTPQMIPISLPLTSSHIPRGFFSPINRDTPNPRPLKLEGTRDSPGS